MGMKRNAYRVLMGRAEEGDHLQDLCVDSRVILTWISGGMEGCGLNYSG
jgi:hypothetical protein